MSEDLVRPGELGQDVLAAVLRAHGGRLVGDGVAATDLQEIVDGIQGWSQWFDAWAALGDRYTARAEECLAQGGGVTAGEFLWSASLSYHYAQFLWFHDPQKREAGQRRKQELYQQAAPYLQPAARRFDLPLEGFSIPGYLRLPYGVGAPSRGPVPCVILLGGLESTKEESYLFEQMCLRRGLATCTFDGPGQGEMFFQTGLRADFERFCSRVVDHLTACPEIDANRIGILGRSLGGYYAVRCAALDSRIKACCVWGALYDLSWWEQIPALTRTGFVYVSRLPDHGEAEAHLQGAINLVGVAEELRSPLYVLHSGKDTILPGDQIGRLEDATRRVRDRTFHMEPEGNHCCHNLYPVIRPRMADWLAARLGAQPAF